MLFNILTWVLAGFTAWGAILNVKKDRRGFLIWMFTNAIWAAIDFYKGIPQQGALFLLYFVLAAWGWLSWSKDFTEYLKLLKRGERFNATR